MNVGALLGAIASLSMARQVPIKNLGALEAEHAGPWTKIVGIRELRDGRVMVLDRREQALRLVDMKSRRMSMIGRLGSGPGEYRLPLRLFALPEDSAAIFDMANSDAPMVITPAGAPGGILEGVGKGRDAFLRLESHVDGQGRVYRMSWGQGRDGRNPLERLDRATGHVDTVGALCRRDVCPPPPGAPRPRVSGGITFELEAADERVPLVTLEQWAVALDGRVAVVHYDPYRVTITETNGSRIGGPVIPYERVRVREPEKQRWREEARQPVPGLVYAAGRTVAQHLPADYVEPRKWPEYLPAFLSDAVAFAPDGMLWVQRATAANAPPSVDVIGRDGRVAFRLTLPNRTRVVGFGANTVYLIRLDDDDVEHLQRYRLPK